MLGWWQGMITNTGTDDERRIRDRRPALPAGRAADAVRKDGSSRSHSLVIARRPRVGDREQERRARPVERTAAPTTARSSIGGAGVRPQDGEAALHVGTRSKHIPLSRLLRASRANGSRGTRTTSTRSAVDRAASCSSRCAAPGGRTSSTRERTDRVDPRWQAVGLRLRTAARVRVAARRRRSHPTRRSRCSTTTAARSPAADTCVRPTAPRAALRLKTR